MSHSSRTLRLKYPRAVLPCLCFALCALAVQAAPADLDRLMAALAQRQHGHVPFVERQYLEVLDRPLESSGELFYDAPDRLEKRTLQPLREILLFEQGTLTVQRGRRKHVLDLHQYPQILPLIESLRATLAGERTSLEQLFEVTFDGQFDRWTLGLTPRAAQAAQMVREIRIEGEATAIRTIEIRQADGDRSVMTLGDEITP